MKRWLPVGAILLLALIPSAYLAWKSRDMPHLGHYHDDGIYWVTAKSLASGGGYRILSLPDQPYQTKYPPFYPLLLSGIWKLDPSFPDNLPLATLFAWLMLPLFLILSRLMFQSLAVARLESWFLCAVLAVNPTVVFLSISLMADLFFCCLVFGSLWLLYRAASRPSGNWMAIAAGLLAGVAYLTRSAALPLLAAGPLWFLIRRQYRRAGFYTLAMMPAVLGWSLWMKSHLARASDFGSLYYTNYVGWQLYNISWSNLPTFLSNNLYFLLTGITQLIVYNTGDSFWAGFYWRLFAFASMAGVWRLAKCSGLTPYHLFAAGFVPLLLLCSWPPDERLVLPVFPLLLAGLSGELRHVMKMLQTAFRRAALAGKAVAAVFCAGLAAFAGLALYYNEDALFKFLPGIVSQHRALLANDRRAYNWITGNLPADATFLAYDDPVLYLYTGRRARGIPVPPKLYYQEGPEGVLKLFYSLADLARQYGVKGLLTTAGDFYRGELTQSQRQLVKRRVGESSAFRQVYESEMASVHLLVGP